MSTFKDLFSPKAEDYARFRPSYPDALFEWLAMQAPSHAHAIDVGTGSGQAAFGLAKHFARVSAFDPSSAQLAHAAAHPRVDYRVSAADAIPSENKTADVVTAAQAFHWFPQEPFFAEVRRVLKPKGLLALWTYPLMRISPKLDALVAELYEQHLGTYWEPERRLVEEGYRNVRVPFAELLCPAFEMRLMWTREAMLGYLGTWSALKRSIAERGVNALETMRPRFEAAWGEAREREVVWPLFVRAFRVDPA